MCVCVCVSVCGNVIRGAELQAAALTFRINRSAAASKLVLAVHHTSAGFLCCLPLAAHWLEIFHKRIPNQGP